MITADLAQNLFAMPVYLEVGGVNLIGALAVPIFYIAAWGLIEIRRLGDDETLIDLEGYGTLIVTRFGDQLRFSRRTDEERTTCGYQEALTEWIKFGREVAQYLLSELPNLVAHPEIGPILNDLGDGIDSES